MDYEKILKNTIPDGKLVTEGPLSATPGKQVWTGHPVLSKVDKLALTGACENYVGAIQAHQPAQAHTDRMYSILREGVRKSTIGGPGVVEADSYTNELVGKLIKAIDSEVRGR